MAISPDIAGATRARTGRIPDFFIVGHHKCGTTALYEMQFRSWMHYPPYSAIANVIIRSEKFDEALGWSGGLGRWFEETRHEGIRVLGPAAAPILRLKRDYRYHFILKSSSREKINALLRAMLSEAAACKIPRTQIIVDVDAVWLM